MNRFIATVKTDFRIQLRNNLYTIGFFVSALLAAAMAWIARPDQLAIVAAAALILIAGGSTLLYVGALTIFEKDEGTLRAIVVSPVRKTEYLWSKVVTLTAIATFETVVIVGGTMLIMSAKSHVDVPNIALLLGATWLTGTLFTLTGIILVVRFKSITDFLVPVSLIATVLQVPFLYFMGVFPEPALLVIPTGGPAMLMFAAFRPLAPWEWIYALGYTALWLAITAIWAHAAFDKYITRRPG